jgi:TolA-binding protein
MKAQERHHLKQNEFAQTAARVAASVTANRDRVVIGLVVTLLVVAVGGGWMYWRSRTNNLASGELGIGLAIARAPITPPSTLPTSTQAGGTYPNEAARHEAALKQFEKTFAEYPSTNAGLAARYHAGIELLGLNRLADAARAFQDVAERGGDSIYAASAKLAMAEALSLEGKHDDAIKRLTDLAADRDGALPVDGVLIQLARASAKAGRTQEARAAYKRVVDEFPESLYAGEARQQLTLLN